MAEITLSDYVGYIFTEVVKARAIADDESRRMALLYAQDAVMQHFSVPRFKIPEMELTIPVLISGARFTTTFRFVLPKEEFVNFIESKLKNVILSIQLKQRQIFNVKDKMPRPPGPIVAPKRSAGVSAAAASSREEIEEFYEQLVKEANQPENVIQGRWYEIFWRRIEENKLVEEYKKHYPDNSLFKQTLTEVMDKIKQNTAVSDTKIQNLLVSPETNVIKSGSDEKSVFVVKAKIMEEGIFIKSIRDEKTGQEKPVVEFE